MKIEKTMVLSLLLAATTALAGVPPVSEADTSASDAKGAVGKVNRSKVLPGTAVIREMPLILVDKSSSHWNDAVDSIIASELAGDMFTNTTITNPVQSAVLMNRMISWRNLVVSTSAPMWNGELAPAAPFDAEKGGPILWWLVDVESAADDISLDMLSLAIISTDGALTDTIGFVGLTYSPRAPLIRADGSKITSGPTSQKGKRFIVLVHGKVFNGGGTQAGLDTVQSYVSGQYPLTLTATAHIGDSMSMAQVSTGPLPAIEVPSLMVMRDGHLFVHGSTNATYIVSASPTVDGTWTDETSVLGETEIPITVTTGMRFFRVRSQQ